MRKRKVLNWLRVVNGIFGLIAIILSIVVLVNPELVIIKLIYILSIALLIVGIARILNGFFAYYLSRRLRTVNIGVGLLAIVISILAMSFSLTVKGLIYL